MSMDDDLDEYAEIIGRYPLLTRDEEIRLSRTINAPGGGRAKQEALLKLISGNYRLVVACCKKFFRRVRLSNMDLIQEGNKALSMAAAKYDHDRHGTKFSTYAYPAIMRAIVDTGYKGYVGQEFVPTNPDKLASLKKCILICDV